ncbi:altered inheritance of mitochondria protein 3-like [Humulus lupulus]|uniref:altered inheritance of mitochondria protein 3-like n=1 Tax=Humulus lupulus TaxID=3486 RepID=UPI002B400779|nr:altered inheritance of mitochondria protein 3-like [Humulus lupulus]
MLVHNFYNGLNGTTRTIIDAAAGGAFMRKSANEAYELLEEMAMNNYQWPNERGQPKKVAGMMEVDAITMLTAQVAALTKQLQKTTLPSQAMQVQNSCEVCGTAHQPNQCPATDMNNMPMEEVQAIGNYQRQPNNPNSMTYNPAWKNNPNFSWSNNQNTLQPYPQPQPPYIPTQNRPPYPQQYAHQNPPPGYYQPQNRPPPPMPMKPAESQPDVLNQFMTETRASIRILETQIGGTKYEGPTVANKGKKSEDRYVTSPAQEEVTADFLKKEKSNEEKVTEDLNKKEVVPPVSIDHHVRVPYPQRLRKHNLDKQFAKFLEVFKKLHINIPFAEALEQMPSYGMEGTIPEEFAQELPVEQPPIQPAAGNFDPYMHLIQNQFQYLVQQNNYQIAQQQHMQQYMAQQSEYQIAHVDQLNALVNRWSIRNEEDVAPFPVPSPFLPYPPPPPPPPPSF